MKKYKLTITLRSDALPGSGEGFGAVIDADIVFDPIGVPFLPAKRIKGCLRESANDVCAMLQHSGIDSLGIDLQLEEAGDHHPPGQSDLSQYKTVNRIFGKPGQDSPSPLYFSNLTIPDYTQNAAALAYFKEAYPALVSAEQVVQTYTYTRQSTAIDEKGIAVDHSLRTCRVLKPDITFEGAVCLETGENQEGFEQLLVLACLHFRRMGYKRKRGFGEIQCRLEDENGKIDVHLLD